ncbi:MAG: right-handed parallel beta-helix repeat-containing protein, partial [Dehalococcoidia bacterium]|nr:right-handed parallel beta-helix repeat-containing protein [Dehalococcoidia bacterium]
EDITLKDGVTLQGAGAGVSIINGTGVADQAVLAGPMSLPTLLDGFTIRASGGDGKESVHIDGASSLVVSNCTITGTGGGTFVWGLHIRNSSPKIEHCTITDNHGNAGFGIGVAHGSPTIINCTISYNQYGIMANWGGSPIIVNSIIHNNGVRGIILDFDSTATITNCTIYGNGSNGIRNVNTPDPTITNCIIWGNGDDLHSFSGQCVATYSNIEDGDAGTGNISLDPLFLDAAGGNFHLQSASPCIDTGDNAAVPGWLTSDFEGDERIIDGNNDTVAIVDMGADEYVPGPISTEKGLSFNGTTDYVDCGSGASFDITEAITIEAWIKTTDNTLSQVVVEKRPLVAEYNYYLRLDNGYVKFSFYNGTHIALVDHTTRLANNTWAFVAVTYDRANIRLYVNGVEVKSVADTRVMIANAGDLVIGKHIYNNTSYFSGLIDEVRISNIARTPEEIDASWNDGIGERFVLDDDTAALWHMNEGSGDTIGDATTNNHGTIYGATWIDGFPFPSEAPPEVISQIAFTTPPQTLLVNQPSEPMTIQTQDGGSPVNVATATTINLTSGGGEFSLSPDPWTPTTSVVISEGTSSATFYYKNSTIGTYTIGAAEDPEQEWANAAQDVHIQGPVQLWRGMALIDTYFTIQEAIDNASDGDDIVVLPGTYEEQINIYKQVTVKSQDAATTIIDAQFGTALTCDFGGGVSAHPAVWIQRDGVEFGDVDTGFTIRNTAPLVFPEGEEDPNEWGVAILADAPGCTIRGNTIEDSNPIGIFADVEMTIISQNTVSALMGIFVGGGDGSILYNAVDSGYWGIVIESGQGNNNVSNNTVSNTWGCAIMVQLGSGHQITNNTLYDNQGTAISLQDTSNAEVTGNYISSDATDVAGIFGIQVEGGHNNDISGNDISYVLVGGIILNETSDNNLSGNDIYDIDGYNLWGDYGGDAWWTGDQVRFERSSVKMWTGEGEGEAGLEFPMSFPFEHWGMSGVPGGGELYFWAYLVDEYGLPRDYWLDHEALLPTYRLALDNGVILEVNTGCEGLA